MVLSLREFKFPIFTAIGQVLAGSVTFIILGLYVSSEVNGDLGSFLALASIPVLIMEGGLVLYSQYSIPSGKESKEQIVLTSWLLRVTLFIGYCVIFLLLLKFENPLRIVIYSFVLSGVTVQLALFRAEGKFQLEFYSTFLHLIIQTVLIFIVERSFNGILGALITSRILQGVIFSKSIKHYSTYFVAIKRAKGILSESLVYLGHSLGGVLFLTLDYIVIENSFKFFNSEYSYYYRFFILCSLVIEVYISRMLPELSKSTFQRRLLTKELIILLMVCAALVSLFFLSTSWYLDFVQGFHWKIELVVYFSSLMVSKVIWNYFGMYITSSGNQRLRTLGTLTVLVSTVVVLVVLNNSIDLNIFLRIYAGAYWLLTFIYGIIFYQMIYVRTTV